MNMEIGWVDFLKEDQNRVQDLIRSLDEGAVDELGLGRIRDAFADYFFPGTSTVQTRAKYFLLVPKMLYEIARKCKTTNEIEELMNKKEKEYRNSLCKQLMNDKKDKRDTDWDGIIGGSLFEEKGWVIRPPRDIYWNGIKTYGICQMPPQEKNLSVNGFVKRLIDSKKKDYDAKKKDYDDDEKWSYKINSDFLNICEIVNEKNIELNDKEADFLKKRICNSKKDSLLAIILNDKNLYELIKEDEVKSFKDCYKKIKKKITDNELLENLILANKFNNLAIILFREYNKILGTIKEEDLNDKDDNIADDIINEDELKKIKEIAKISDNSELYKFLLAVIENIRNNEDNKGIITEREKRIKKDKSKIYKKEEGKDSFKEGEWVGMIELDYRYKNAKKLITDIYNAKK